MLFRTFTAAVASLLASTIFSPAGAELIWGVNGHPFTAYPGVTYAQQLDYVADLGTTSYRVNIRDEGDARHLEVLVAEAKKRGIDILPVVTPSFDLTKTAAGDLYDKSFKLAVALVSRFKDDIRIWELGNEMENYAIIKPCEMQDDGVQYNCAWGPAGGVGPLEYYGPRWAKVSAVLKGLSDGTMSVDPTIRKAMGTAGWGHVGAFERMKKDGVRWDISVWHAYGQDPEWAFKKIAEYGKPIWVTELNHPYGSKQDGEEGQASGLRKEMLRLKALETAYKVEAVHIYELLDETYWAPDFEGFMGLVTLEKKDGRWAAGRPKLAYETVQDVIGKAGSPRRMVAAEAGPPIVERNCDLATHATRGSRPGQQVAYSYCLILGRRVDGRGLKTWTQEIVAGLSIPEFLERLIGSSEFSSSRKLTGLSDASYVTYIHGLLLGSARDANAHSALVRQLQEGAVSRVGIAKRILASGEFQRAHRVLFPDQNVAKRDDAKSLVKRNCDLEAYDRRNNSHGNQVGFAYCLVLGREPDTNGLQSWVKARERGMSFYQLLLALIGSDEFKGRLAGTTNKDLVVGLYRLLLERDPDDVGLASYVPRLDSGAMQRTEVASDIIHSQEFAWRRKIASFAVTPTVPAKIAK